MIRRLEIENFYSIRDLQVIDLAIGDKVPEDLGRFGHFLDGSDLRAPKTIALLGANASGKSNVLKALAFIRWFLLDSFGLTPEMPLPLFRFADGNIEPIALRVHFEWNSNLADPSLRGDRNSRYSYELSLRGELGALSVNSEQLRFHPKTGKSKRVFQRTPSGEVTAGEMFPIAGLGHVLSKLRPNVSLTATIAQFIEHPETKSLLDWARSITANILVEKTDVNDQAMIAYYATQPNLVDDLNRALARVDTGIRSVTMVQTPLGIQPQFHHLGLKHPLLLPFESEGTRQFLRVYPHLWEALRNGGIALIDEFDSAIHASLLPELLRWFYDPSTNKHQAQLWFSGHSASILEELEKEEAFFTEKDTTGRTKITGLRDIEGVRRVDNFYQKYMGGVYGAVPRIG
jgi:uncharacterized protein